jgi:hypothetical protein
MLGKAFLETADYHALVTNRDFNFVVGRRGTGKSALFERVTAHFAKGRGDLMLCAKPEEFENLALQQAFSGTKPEYREVRAVTRLAWKTHLLYWALPIIMNHYKVAGTENHSILQRLYYSDVDFAENTTPSRLTEIVNRATAEAGSIQHVPAAIARKYEVTRLQTAIQASLAEINRKVLVYIDGLDEGWLPTATATAVLGGLAIAVADLEESQSGIHGTLFVRDNMFRALAYFDPDFSRHVEGNTLRLHWDEASLFDLVARRLRVALDLGHIENSERVWNQFAGDGISNRDGFERCLHHTLYRPRDILVLLNQSYHLARRRGRDRVEGEDVNSAAVSISHDRLQDLIKEYEEVLPGIRPFVEAFEGRNAFGSVQEVTAHLSGEIESGAYDEAADSDFAIFGSARQVLFALYGVGFLGFEDRSRKSYVFCHDGSGAELEEVTPELTTVVHPCYWKALELRAVEDPEDVAVQINDEFDSSGKDSLGDLRIKRLGQVVSELPKIEIGSAGARQFEEWTLRAVKLLFAGKLANPELHPDPQGVQRRDVVATNVAEHGLWRRIRDDFDSRQLIFEVKNYEELKIEDYRQLLSYTSGPYGRFGVILHRGSSEGVAEKDRKWLQTMYYEHDRVILTVPDSFLVRAISKLRNAGRFDYVEDQLSKRLDTFVRNP